jgi:predicted phage terminase large subunit-like protein
VILDDPLSVDDAHSEAALESAERTFKEALPTRVNNDRSAIVVIMQRLHERDTSGIILDLKLGYEHLCLPMRFEASRRCKTSIGFVDPRKKDGELFFPERFSEETVASLEAILGEYATAGQLQQRPSPAEGGIIKRSWFKLMQSDGDLPKLQFIVQSYDTAFTDKTLNDATAMVTWGVFNTPQGKAVLLLDAWKDRLQYPDLRRKMYDEYKSAYGDNEKKVDVVLIEEKGSGISLVQDLRRARIPIHTYNPGNANKSTRVHSVAPLIEAGLVYLPASKKRPGQAPVWTDEMMHELLAFPNAEHDDYVDAFTQSLIYLRDSGLLTIDADKYDKEYPTAPRERENPYAA